MSCNLNSSLLECETDRRRKGFVEAGGVTELTKMLKSASDEKTQLEAVKALVALCECGITSC